MPLDAVLIRRPLRGVIFAFLNTVLPSLHTFHSVIIIKSRCGNARGEDERKGSGIKKVKNGSNLNIPMLEFRRRDYFKRHALRKMESCTCVRKRGEDIVLYCNRGDGS